MTALAALAFGCWVVTVGLHALMAAYAWRHFRRQPTERGQELPPISILKPLKGVTSTLRENLERFFQFDYPEYEILFAIANPDDPAVSLVKELIAKYPKVSARLVPSAEKQILNPKFSTLLSAYDAARFEWIFISDANGRLPLDFLRHWARYLSPTVGMVAGITAGAHPVGIGGFLDAVYINSFYARGTLFCLLVGQTATPGIAQLFRRSVADRVGGLREVGQNLGADVHLGRAILAQKFEVVLAAEPIAQANGFLSFAGFWKRHLRWGRVHKRFAPLIFLIEPVFSSSIGSAFVGAFAAQFLFSVSFWVFFCAHLAFWFLADATILAKMMPEVSAWRWFPAYLLRELLGLPRWLHVLCGSEAEWAGHRFEVRANGKITEK